MSVPGDKPSQDEIYDRQIRLWGSESQAKMINAKILYINISGVSSEILKNMVLAGISPTLIDERPYPDAVLKTPSSFLSTIERSDHLDLEEVKDSEPPSKRKKKMTVAKAIQPHVEELNPLLGECEINEASSMNSDDYFGRFDIVIASQIGFDEAIRISKATIDRGGKFYLVESFGFSACAILDLGPEHMFRKEIGKDRLSENCKLEIYTSMEEIKNKMLGEMKDRWHKNGPPGVWVSYRSILHYHSVRKKWPHENDASDFVDITSKFLKEQGLKDDYLGNDMALTRLASTATFEIASVTSVMGGIIGNEVIKAISGKGEPANNIVLFDGYGAGCMNFTVR